MSTVSEHHRYVAAAVLNNSLLLQCFYFGVFVDLSLCIVSDVILLNAQLRPNGGMCVEVLIYAVMTTRFRIVKCFQEMLGRSRIFSLMQAAERAEKCRFCP